MKKYLQAFVVVLFAAFLVLGATYAGDVKSTSLADSENWVMPEDQPVLTLADYDLNSLVTLGDYKNLTLDVEYTEITDDYVKSQIEATMANYPGYVETDKTTVEDGDVVNIDYVGTQNGVAFDGGTAEGYNLTIGSGTFIDGFEEGLLGATVGDAVTLNLTFPEDYSDATLAGQAVEFAVTVNAIMEEVTYTYDEMTDDYVYQNTGYETKDALFEYAKQYYEENAESEKTSNARTALVDKILENATVELPEEYLDYKVLYYLSNMKANLDSQGYDVLSYLTAYYGVSTTEEFYDQVVEMMTESAKQQMVLTVIADKEGIALDEDGYAEYVQSFVSYYGYEDENALYEDYPEDELRTAYRCNDVIDTLLESTTINYIATEEEE